MGCSLGVHLQNSHLDINFTPIHLLLCCESLVGQVAHSIWVASLVIGFYMLVFVCFIYLFCLLYGLIVLLPILDLRCRFPLSYCSLCVLLGP